MQSTTCCSCTGEHYSSATPLDVSLVASLQLILQRNTDTGECVTTTSSVASALHESKTDAVCTAGYDQHSKWGIKEVHSLHLPFITRHSITQQHYQDLSVPCRCDQPVDHDGDRDDKVACRMEEPEGVAGERAVAGTKATRPVMLIRVSVSTRDAFAKFADTATN